MHIGLHGSIIFRIDLIVVALVTALCAWMRAAFRRRFWMAPAVVSGESRKRNVSFQRHSAACRPDGINEDESHHD